MIEILVWERVIWLFVKIFVDFFVLGCNGWKLILIIDCYKYLIGRSYIFYYIIKLLVFVVLYIELRLYL